MFSWLKRPNNKIDPARIQRALKKFEAAPAASSKGRRAPRRRSSGNGTIILPNGSRQSIALVDLSETGARLQLSSANRLPTRFQLVMPGLGLDGPVRVAWQTSFEAGVYFV